MRRERGDGQGDEGGDAPAQAVVGIGEGAAALGLASVGGGGLGEQSGALFARAERALWSAVTEEAEALELTFYED